MIYPVLEDKMKDEKIKALDIAGRLGLNINSFYNRLNNKNLFKINECKIIKDVFFPNSTIDELFITTEEIIKKGG